MNTEERLRIYRRNKNLLNEARYIDFYEWMRYDRMGDMDDIHEKFIMLGMSWFLFIFIGFFFPPWIAMWALCSFFFVSRWIYEWKRCDMKYKGYEKEWEKLNEKGGK